MRNIIPGLRLTLMGAVGGASMSRNLKSIALYLLLFSSATVQASPIALSCTVENFVSTDLSADTEFVDANLRRKFVLSIEEKEVLVTSISDSFSSGIQRYKILGTDFLGQIKAVQDLGMLFEFLYINHDNGRVTISLQDPQDVNVWQLGCKKQ